MENIIYNEPCGCDFSEDAGLVEYCYKDTEKTSKHTQLEIDFVANKTAKSIISSRYRTISAR